MTDPSRTNQELLEEISILKQKIKKLEHSESEHRQAEEALRESEHRLHSIIDGSPIPTFVIGKDHRVLHWNKALEEISSIQSEEVVGTREHWKTFYSEERPCMADLLVDEAVELIPQWYSGKYIKSPLIEDAYEAADFIPALGEHGKRLRFTAAAIRDSKGMTVAAVETMEDITDHKRVEEALRQSEESYRKLSTKLRDAYLWMSQKKDKIEARKYNESIIFLIADDGRICGFTEEALGITKKSHSDIQDCNIQDILVPQEGQAFMDLIHKVRPRMSHHTTIRFKNQLEDRPVYEAKLTHFVVESKKLFFIVLY